VISELRSVTVAVSDLDRAASFFSSGLGYESKGLGDFSDHDRDLALAWRLPHGLRGRYAVMGPPGVDSSVIRLLSFSSPGEHIWDEDDHFHDTGPFALNFRVRSLDQTLASLEASGAHKRTERKHWPVFDGVSADECQWVDPDGLVIDVFELSGSKVANHFGELETLTSGIHTVVMHSNDADRSKSFYQGLGFSVLYDQVLKDVEWLTGLPEGSELRNVNLQKPELSPLGRVEITAHEGNPGADKRNVAVPPNIGILALSFETDDLEHTAELVTGLGGLAIGEGAGLTIPPWGAIRLRTFFGLNGEVLEFFQRDSSETEFDVGSSISDLHLLVADNLRNHP